MKALGIARKTLLEYLREPLLLGLLFAFPIMLLFVYYIAFGETDQGLAKHFKVLVSNQDQGPLGDQFTQVVRLVEFEGKPVFDVRIVSDQPAAENTLREGKAALLLHIPADFSQIILNDAAQGGPAIVSLVGFPNSYNFLFAQSYLDDMVRQFASQAAGPTELLPPVHYDFVEGTGAMSDFDFGVAGLLVFATMFLTISTAMTLVRENVNGTLDRLKLTAAGAKDLLLGVALAQMVVALAIVPVTFHGGNLASESGGRGFGAGHRLLCPQRWRSRQSRRGHGRVDGLGLRRHVSHALSTHRHHRRPHHQALRHSAPYPRVGSDAPGAHLRRGDRCYQL